MKRVSLLSSLTIIKLITTLTVIMMLAACNREVPLKENANYGDIKATNYRTHISAYRNIEGISFINASAKLQAANRYQTYKD